MLFSCLIAKLSARIGIRVVNRNILFLVIGALAAVVVVLGYQFYQSRQKTTGVEINIGEHGVSIEKK